MTKHIPLDIRSMALAFGVLYAIIFLGLGIFAMQSQRGEVLLALYALLFRGMSATPSGILIGVIWGFVSGAMMGGVLAWLYNWFLSKK